MLRKQEGAIDTLKKRLEEKTANAAVTKVRRQETAATNPPASSVPKDLAKKKKVNHAANLSQKTKLVSTDDTKKMRSTRQHSDRIQRLMKRHEKTGMPWIDFEPLDMRDEELNDLFWECVFFKNHDGQTRLDQYVSMPIISCLRKLTGAHVQQ